MMTSERILSNLRRFLLIVALLMYVGTVVELWLLDHNQDAIQIIPFILCAVGMAAVIGGLFSPSRVSLLTLRVVAVIEAIGSLFGIGYHAWTNFSFESEIRPNAAFETLIVPTLKGAAPLIAPGALMFAALIATAATYYHPVMTTPKLSATE